MRIEICANTVQAVCARSTFGGCGCIALWLYRHSTLAVAFLTVAGVTSVRQSSGSGRPACERVTVGTVSEDAQHYKVRSLLVPLARM
eukprot:6772854-Pyramimonas_sp.AAC.1